MLFPSLCFFFVPYNPLGIFFPLGPFQCFHQWDYMIQIEGVLGTMVYYGHHLVCVNESFGVSQDGLNGHGAF
jgi:hypothetical protein